VEHGVKEIKLDGQRLAGNIIPPHGDGQIHRVQVLMGKRRP